MANLKGTGITVEEAKRIAESKAEAHGCMVILYSSPFGPGVAFTLPMHATGTIGWYYPAGCGYRTEGWVEGPEWEEGETL